MISRRPDLGVGEAALVVAVSVAAGGVQLHHSIAVGNGHRPWAGIWTFLVLVAVVYVPMPWFGGNWVVAQWFTVASAAMMCRGASRAVLVAGPVVGTAVVEGWETLRAGQEWLDAVTILVYDLVVLGMGAMALYGSARLVRIVGELHAGRIELAELAVGRERLRVSRDLHDLLGQSLSAVSLKGDLALRLLRSDAAAARAEISSLTEVARGALRDVRAVARDEHAVSLPAEIDAAAALLGAGGIVVEVDVAADVTAGDPAVEQVLGWAVREGATNVMRHSDARTCVLRAARRDGTIRLEVVNDGVRRPLRDRRGLAGLGARAGELAGSLTAGQAPDGRFRLVVEVPEGQM